MSFAPQTFMEEGELMESQKNIGEIAAVGPRQSDVTTEESLTSNLLLDKSAWDDSMLIETWDRAMQYYENVTAQAIKEGKDMDGKLKQHEMDSSSLDFKVGEEPIPTTVFNFEESQSDHISAEKSSKDFSAFAPSATTLDPSCFSTKEDPMTDDFTRLLMAWYYAGYYTGYYQAKRESR